LSNQSARGQAARKAGPFRGHHPFLQGITAASSAPVPPSVSLWYDTSGKICELAQALDLILLTRLRELLPPPEASPPPPPGLLPAGVLVPLFPVNGELHLLFTQRTYTVRDHQGQISFPGGVRDSGDPDLLTTAVRETEEEIGLKAEVVEVLGRLPPVATVTGYWINPFVALIPHPYEFRPNPVEVSRLLVFAVREFLPPERWSTSDYEYQGRVIRVCCWKQGDTVIWGATARILLHLLALLGENPLAGRGPECQD